MGVNSHEDNKRNTLIVGGTAGLGAALAESFKERGDTVFVTGRHNPEASKVHYLSFNLNSDQKNVDIQVSEVLSKIDRLDTFVYSIGVNHVGLLDSFSFEELAEMVNAGLLAAMEFVRQIVLKQKILTELIIITSTSATIPRKNEPTYAAAKSGLTHFAKSAALDDRISKTLVVAPAGMNTRMQQERGRSDLSELLDPTWVADQIVRQLLVTKKFREVLILRDPDRIEVVIEA